VKPACDKLYVAFGTLPSGEYTESWACGMPDSARALFRETHRTATLQGMAVYQLVSVAEGLGLERGEVLATGRPAQLTFLLPARTAFPLEVEYTDTGERAIIQSFADVAPSRAFKILRTSRPSTDLPRPIGVRDGEASAVDVLEALFEGIRPR